MKNYKNVKKPRPAKTTPAEGMKRGKPQNGFYRPGKKGKR